ncbi:MAG: DUF3199 family protein [Clostridia bacterium]|nr:DUF3199 family protein [Clostridia bacterium]
MANRPWVTPEEVKEYSENKDVQERNDIRLEFDIARAEAQIIKYCNNDFSSYDIIPDDVKKAVILLSEKYAVSAIKIKKGGILSESFDDYSYSSDSNYSIDIDDLGLEALLDKYKQANTGNINMSLWKL